MIMDIKDTDSDLHALKRLYGLLKRDGEGTSHMLDDRARLLLLKNLLDEATKRILKIPHSEYQPSTLPKLSENAEGTRSDKDIWKEKRLEQTKSMESVVASGRTKRCRVCQKDTVKQLESIEETQFYDAVQNPDIFSDKQNDESDHYLWNNQQKTGSCSGSLLSNNNKMVAADIAKAYINSNPDIEGMSEEVNCLSEEASKAINIGADDHHLQKVNKFHGQNVTVDNFEPGNWILSQNIFLPSRFHNVQDFRCPAIYSPASKIGSSYESSKWASYKNHRPKPSRLLAGSRFQEKDGIPNTRQYITAPRMTCLQQQESEGTATDSNSSYSRSQQARSGDGDSDSVNDSDSDSDSQEYSFSSMSNENVYSSYTSNSGDDDEVYSSSTSGEPAREVTSRSSSKSQEYSSANRIKHKKEGGVWRKLKDKLAIVFHHHHHHHHHHHPIDKNTSSRKRKGTVFNSKRSEEAYGERVVEKKSKSQIREKNQQNHFHGLMEGLMRHVKHSKKSKQGKEAVGKKSLKKSHWWQLVQHHRGAKLPNKTQLKLGFAKKRTRLKALPRPK